MRKFVFLPYHAQLTMNVISRIQFNLLQTHSYGLREKKISSRLKNLMVKNVNYSETTDKILEKKSKLSCKQKVQYFRHFKSGETIHYHCITFDND